MFTPILSFNDAIICNFVAWKIGSIKRYVTFLKLLVTKLKDRLYFLSNSVIYSIRIILYTLYVEVS